VLIEDASLIALSQRIMQKSEIERLIIKLDNWKGLNRVEAGKKALY